MRTCWQLCRPAALDMRAPGQGWRLDPAILSSSSSHHALPRPPVQMVDGPELDRHLRVTRRVHGQHAHVSATLLPAVCTVLAVESGRGWGRSVCALRVRGDEWPAPRCLQDSEQSTQGCNPKHHDYNPAAHHRRVPDTLYSTCWPTCFGGDVIHSDSCSLAIACLQRWRIGSGRCAAWRQTVSSNARPFVRAARSWLISRSLVRTPTPSSTRMLQSSLARR